MIKHTDAPWEIDEGEISGTFVVFQDGSQDAIATVWANYSEKENDANARLIAASPDLLMIAEIYLGYEEAQQMAPTPRLLALRAAIAKARGEEE